MKRITFSIFPMIIAAIFLGCAKSPPSEREIFDLIQKESVISSHDYFELKSASIETSSFEDVNFKAVLKLTFLYTGDSKVWTREDKYDFIPSGTTLNKGLNSMDATALFERSYAGDGSWHLAGFSM